MNHQIVKDEQKLKEFLDFLPNLTDIETFLVCLQARKKYADYIRSSDIMQLKRFLTTKEWLYRKLKQLECEVGTYKTKEGNVITDDAMATYITINPRCMRKASFMAIREMTASLEHNRAENPYTITMSCIHRSKSRSVYVDFDIDNPTGSEKDDNAPKSELTVEELYEKASDIVGEKAVKILVTRGGFHLTINPSMVESSHKDWFRVIRDTVNAYQVGDMMLPIPGCNQGGFTPYFYEKT